MQSFTTDKDFPCSIKFLHGRLKIVSAKFRRCLTFHVVYNLVIRSLSEIVLNVVLIVRVSLPRSTVAPTKSDSDVIFCLQLLGKTLTCTHHLR